MRTSTRMVVLGGFKGVLDLISVIASAAYGLRRLRRLYTGFCIRVRRSSDNSELDIGFIGEDLDVVTLLAFVGSGSGFVTIWYDQSGNGRHATQATAGRRPRIVSNGVVDLINSKPSLVFSGNQWLLASVASSGITGALVSAVFQSTEPTSTQQMFDWRKTGNTTPLIDDGAAGGFALRVRNDDVQLIGTAPSAFNANPHVYSGVWNNGLLDVRLDGGTSATANVSGQLTLDLLGIGTNGATPGTNNWSGRTSEMLTSTVLISAAARQALERNQGSYYNITVA